MKHRIVFALIWVGALLAVNAFGQASSDTSSLLLNSEAIYNRPFLKHNPLPFAVGAYLETRTNYGGTNGEANGFAFDLPDLALFFGSDLNNRMKFLSELAFEGETNQLKLRYAAMDVQFYKLLNLRGGLILNPIGSFNQNHDGPNYEFVDRPISSTTILPGVLSNVGFGLYGKTGSADWTAGYELYLSNGFNDHIIDNLSERTDLSAGVSGFNNPSGKPMLTGKIAVKNRLAGELGFSFLRGIYSEFGSTKSSIGIFAVDYQGAFFNNKLNIKGEWSKVALDVPTTYIQTYGNAQMGAFVDIVGTVLQQSIFGWEDARVNLALRLEYADYNQEKFKETGGDIGDHLFSIVPGLSFRPTPKSVFRINYRYQEKTDFLGNLPAKTGAIQFGFGTYF
jgi:hypothetical protein